MMAWRRPGAKTLSEPMMVSLLKHICVTRPQWVKRSPGQVELIGLMGKWHIWVCRLCCVGFSCFIHAAMRETINISDKQRFLTPGHQGWNDLHSLCRIGMEYYLLNNDDNNIIYWIMMIIMIMMMVIIMIIMMTMMIIGTATIMIMIIIITTTLTMTIMKMIMIKTAQTPCQSLYKDRRI